MNQNPIIKALQDDLAKEREYIAEKYQNVDCIKGQSIIENARTRWAKIDCKYGHEAATARLLGLLEKALLVIEFNANLVTWVDSKNQNISHTYAFGVEKAREFLTTLADGGAK